MLDTQITTEPSIKYEKDLIMVMIQTEEINQYVKDRYTLRQNKIKLYRLI